MTTSGRLSTALLAVLVAQAGFLSIARGAAGDLDAGFSFDGKVTTAIGGSTDVANGVAVQDDGRIVVVGTSYDETDSENDFALVRYLPDGSLDSTFGESGKVVTDIGADDDANAVAIQDDGKIVVAGYSDDGDNRISFAVVRYDTNGDPDNSFDDDAIVTTDVDGAGENDSGYARAVAIQDDGKIVVAGESYNGSTYEFTLVRYESDGDPDTTFDDDGIATALVGTGDNSGYDVAIQDDGKIVVAGTAANGGLGLFGMVRFTTDGDPDAGFGAGGEVTTDIGADEDLGYAVAIQPDGRIVMAGSTYNDSSRDFALVRYDPGGGVDTSFGDGGNAITDTNGEPRAVAIQDDGRIVAAGSGTNGDGVDFAVARYEPDGSLDAGFGTGGTVYTHIGFDQGKGLALHDGKIVTAGWAEAATYDFGVVRYLGRSSRSASVKSSAASRVFGRSFTLSTQLSSDDPTCVAGTAVKLERDILGGPVAFAPVATLTTDAEGRSSITRTADRGATYRARVAGSDSCESVVASTVVKVKKKVTLKAPRKVAKGTIAKLKVLVAPCSGHRKAKVTLQRKTASGFKKVATQATNVKCIAVFKVVMNKTTVFRALAPKTDADHLAGVSRKRTVRV
jgi:uncharacterized delta-60 repeat protein